MHALKLNTPLEEISAFQRRFLPKLNKLGIRTVSDLLYHFPSRYEDWREVSDIANLKKGDEKTIKGIIQEIKQVRAWRKRMTITEALIADKSASIRAVWFNQPYIGQMLKEGIQVNLAGKVSVSKGKIYLSNPAYEIIPKDGGKEAKHTARIVPIYPETKGLTSKGIRFILKSVIESAEKSEEFIPESILKKMNLPEINRAMHYMHFPEKMEDTKSAKRRFAFQDLFLLQLKNAQEKNLLKTQRARDIKWSSDRIKAVLSNLPFELTDSQKESLDDILQDISRKHPMNRLLQGDVGSGKTIVAGVAAIITADPQNNLQSAFMAPTEILARQHYKTLASLFDKFTSGIGLLLSKEAHVFYGDGLDTKIAKSKFLKDAANGKIAIVVGTHTLVQKSVKFKKLGLVVIDEQHRFGVRQRAELAHNKEIAPHFLSMSATPIPRTLMMTAFGNLDISLITELPKGRRPIITKVVDPANRDKAYAFIRGEVRKGRQVYVVCPRIEVSNVEGEKKSAWDEVKAVKEEYEKLSRKVFPDLSVGMLHGKLKKEEKEKIMSSFVSGETDLLVSTSVIEVGVDVPNATIMMIEGADRFGLAQLYQFRGRVGRGEHQSFCFLFSDSETASSNKRLESLITAKNSFELAEKDLKIRGPGEFLGSEQSGMPDIAMKAIQNPRLLSEAKKAANDVLSVDPELNKNELLAIKLRDFDSNVHLE